MRIDVATQNDLAELSQFASRRQSDPESHIAYLSIEASDIASELEELDAWHHFTLIARDENRLLGWLTAETDEEIGRVWWLGPFCLDDDWDSIADDLLLTARRDLTAQFTQEEAASDDRHVRLDGWCRRHGFTEHTASAALDLRSKTKPDRDSAVVVMSDTTRASVAMLHDRYFPGSHRTGDQLVAHDQTTVLVRPTSPDASDVDGYVATQHQADGSTYIDFLGVVEHARRTRVATQLIRAVTSSSGDDEAHFHLTVRADNEAARRLYNRLGFEETRVVVPYRLGFSLDPQDAESD